MKSSICHNFVIKTRRFQGLPADNHSYTGTSRIRKKNGVAPCSTQDMSFQNASILDNNTMQVGGELGALK